MSRRIWEFLVDLSVLCFLAMLLCTAVLGEGRLSLATIWAWLTTTGLSLGWALLALTVAGIRGALRGKD